jgi:chromosome segregation ATPase
MATQEQIDNLKRQISDIRSTIAVYRRDLEEIENETLDANIAIAAAEKAGNTEEVSRLKAVKRELRTEKMKLKQI